MVIDFTASWCGPCKLLDPVIQEFAAKYTEVEFVKIDVDELIEVSQEFHLQTMPTFMLIKKGKVADNVVGVTKEELQRLIEQQKISVIMHYNKISKALQHKGTRKDQQIIRR
ncbi:thioredoxin H8-like [Abrus precatorius]|uniref:Thioredoxin H8-like n=1 Tax=Abrus precatorius TaxID=3816 RepID=A0A8B8KXR4_ABRPR|nr:thioredoxin H8-like [Abrus precatorius]